MLLPACRHLKVQSHLFSFLLIADLASHRQFWLYLDITSIMILCFSLICDAFLYPLETDLRLSIPHLRRWLQPQFRHFTSDLCWVCRLSMVLTGVEDTLTGRFPLFFLALSFPFELFHWHHFWLLFCCFPSQESRVYLLLELCCQPWSLLHHESAVTMSHPLMYIQQG